MSVQYEVAGFVKAASCTAIYWRVLNSKRRLLLLESTTESEYMKKNFLHTTNPLTPRCACAARGKKLS